MTGGSLPCHPSAAESPWNGGSTSEGGLQGSRLELRLPLMDALLGISKDGLTVIWLQHIRIKKVEVVLNDSGKS